MTFNVLRRLSMLGRRATDVSDEVRQSVGGTLGIKAGLPSPVAIDFGTSALKVLQVSPGDPPQLMAATALETPANMLFDNMKRLEFQVNALPKMVRQGGFKGKRAVCSIPAWATMCKQVQFPSTEGVGLDALVNGAIQTELNMDPEAFVTRHIEVGNGSKTGGKADVIIIATPRDVIDRFMKAMLDAKLEPVGMHSEFVAFQAAFGTLLRRAEDQHRSTLFLEIGTSTTRATISHGSAVVFARSIDVGGRHIDEVAGRQMSCGAIEARRVRLALDRLLNMPVTPVTIKPTSGASPPRATVSGSPVPSAPMVAERRDANVETPGLSGDVLHMDAVPVAPADCDVREPLEMLTDELLMSVRYHASQYPGRRLDRVIIGGGEGRHRGLCQHIARTLRLPTFMGDPLVRMSRTGDEPSVGVDFRMAQPGWSVVFGLCHSRTDI